MNKKDTQKKTILIVDDNEGDRKLMCLALKDEGYHILEASSGEEGLVIFKNHLNEIGLVLTDIIMPGMDGVEFVQNIRKLLPKTNVIFISGCQRKFSEHDDCERVNFVEKSTNVSLLVQKAHKILDYKNPFMNLIDMFANLL